MSKTPTSADPVKPGLSVTLKNIARSPRNLAMLFLGASAGLPIMLVYQVLSIWMREADVSRSTIGFFVWVGFAYSLKFLWAPLVDRVRIPGFSNWLGNRRGWTLFAILGTALAMWGMSLQDPAKDLETLAVCAVLIAFASATLDICVDAWRVDNASNADQAMVSAIYQMGYRFGMIAAVTGGLFIADIGGFQMTYLILGGLAVLGASTPLWIEDMTAVERPQTNRVIAVILGLGTLLIIAALLWLGLMEGGWLRTSIGWIGQGMRVVPKSLAGGLFIFVLASPFLIAIWFISRPGRAQLQAGTVYAVPILGDFADLVRRTGGMALVVLAIIVTYRISDTTMGVMAGPLYIDLGYEISVIGTVKGAFGISVLIFGAFLGGLSAIRYGMGRSMIIGAVLTIVTNLAFAWLAQVESPRAAYLFVTIGADNIAAGFAGSIFIAFMSILANKAISATQYALFSSLFAFFGKSLAGFSGVLADAIGYQSFFVVTAVFGVPALLLSVYVWMTGFIDGIDEDSTPKEGPFVNTPMRPPLSPAVDGR